MAASRKLRTKPAPRFDEKRNYVRAPIRILVHTQFESTIAVGESINLSGGGMLLATDVRARVGERLMTKFALPKIPQSILAEARVTHVSRKDDCSQWSLEVGLQFIDLEDSLVTAINQACVAYLTHHDREALKLVKAPMATEAPLPRLPETTPKPLEASPSLAKIPLHVQIRFGTEEEFLGEYLRNITKNGITIDTEAHVATFSDVVVDLIVPKAQGMLRLHGVAVHQYANGGGPRKSVGIHLNRARSTALVDVHQLASQMLAQRENQILEQAA